MAGGGCGFHHPASSTRGRSLRRRSAEAAAAAAVQVADPLPQWCDSYQARPVFLCAAAERVRSASVRRRKSPSHLLQAWRASAGGRRRVRHALRRLGAERAARQRRGLLQPLGRPQARDAVAGRVRDLGTVHPGGGAGSGVQIRDPDARRSHAPQGGPIRLRDAAAARQLLDRRRARRLRMGR